MKESREGLEATGKLTLDTKRGAEAYALMKDRALGLSIGFAIPPGGAAYERDGTRTIKKIQLFEVSAVAMPANPGARITSVKALRPESIRDLETTVARRAGLLGARGQGARIERAGAALSPDAAKSEELSQIAALLRDAAAHINR